MAEEVVRLTNQNDDMEELVKDIPRLQLQLKVRSSSSDICWKQTQPMPCVL